MVCVTTRVCWGGAGFHQCLEEMCGCSAHRHDSSFEAAACVRLVCACKKHAVMRLGHASVMHGSLLPLERPGAMRRHAAVEWAAVGVCWKASFTGGVRWQYKRFDT